MCPEREDSIKGISSWVWFRCVVFSLCCLLAVECFRCAACVLLGVFPLSCMSLGVSLLCCLRAVWCVFAVVLPNSKQHSENTPNSKQHSENALNREQAE